MVFFTTLLLMTGVVLQLQAVFGVFAARLARGFIGPHIAIAGAVIVGALAFQTAIYARGGIRAFPLIALQIVSIGIFAAATFIVEQRLQTFSPQPGLGKSRLVHSLLRTLSGLLQVLLLFAAGAYISTAPYVLESFVRGEMPWTTWGMLLAGIGLIGASTASARGRVVALAEAGAAPCLTFADLQRQAKDMPPLFRGWERRLHRLRPLGGEGRSIWLVRALRAGNTMTLASTLLFLMLPLGGAFIGSALVFSWGGKPVTSGLPLMMAVFLPVVVVGSSLQSWWRRVKALQREMLYPATRRELTRAVFGGVLTDIAVFSALVVPAMAAAAFLSPLPAITASQTVAAILATVAMLAVLGGGALYLLTIRHAIVAVLTGYFGGCLLCLAGPWLLLWLLMGDAIDQRPAQAMLLVAIYFASLCGLLIAAAYRRFLRIEWGTVAAG
jgi:hypothetical protein